MDLCIEPLIKFLLNLTPIHEQRLIGAIKSQIGFRRFPIDDFFLLYFEI